MSRVPPNRGISLYIIKRRHRYDRQTCGKWQKWVSVRYCSNADDALTHLANIQLRPLVEEAAIFYKGERFLTVPAVNQKRTCS